MQGIVSFIVLLSVLIFVHELGHFLAAKGLNVKVTRFSIGFGPRLLGFTRGETEYQVASIPLGGYVKMAGEVGDDSAPGDEARGFLAQAPWKRALIVGAGPAASLGFPVLVYLVMFLAFPQTSSRVMALEPGMPAAEAGVRVGDLITSVDGTAVHTFAQLQQALENKGGKEVSLVLDRGGQTVRLRLVTARADEGTTRPGPGKLGVAAERRAPLVGVLTGSAAERAGLRTFDRIVSVDGSPVPDLPTLERLLSASRGDVVRVEALRRAPLDLPGVEAVTPERIQVEVPRQAGEGLRVLGVELPDLYLSRVLPGTPGERAGLVAGDRLVALDGRPIVSSTLFRLKLHALRDAPFQLTWLHAGAERSSQVQQAAVSDRDVYGREVKLLDLGILLPLEGYQGERQAILVGERATLDRVRLGPGPALVASFRMVGDTIVKVGMGLGLLLTGQVPFSNLGGPIMLYSIASQSAQAGLDHFLGMMAVISINLGLLNLLPIPVLDGFGLLSTFWEWIRRRPIPLRAREIANLFGLAMLVLLMIAVFKNDIARLLM
ncbi:MAG TPA: RIP metalloprotease RseP [Myxococcaceae bacterium]|nr:RIP metalloprotease RseP [Myxococcaceae bacterium]